MITESLAVDSEYFYLVNSSSVSLSVRGGKAKYKKRSSKPCEQKDYAAPPLQTLSRRSPPRLSPVIWIPEIRKRGAGLGVKSQFITILLFNILVFIQSSSPVRR